MKRQLTDAEVKHLRQLLAWMRCEWSLDEDSQRGYLDAIKKLMENGQTDEVTAMHVLSEKAEKINSVPKYVRQAVKMLTKTIREFDGQKGATVDVETRDVQEICND